MLGVLPELARAIYLDMLPKLARAIQHFSDGIFLFIISSL